MNGILKSIISIIISSLFIVSSFSDGFCMKVYAAEKVTVTEDMIYELLPQYLENSFLDAYYSNVESYCVEALDKVSDTDVLIAAGLESIKSGISVDIRELGSLIGITSSNYETYNKKIAGELLKEYFNAEKSVKKELDDTYKDYEYLVKTHNAFTDALIDDIAKKSEHYSKEQVKGLFNNDTIFKKVNKKFDKVVDAVDIYITVLELNEMQLDVIDELIASTDLDSDLISGLIELRSDITSDLATYLLNNYFNDLALKKISKFIEKGTVEVVFGGYSALLSLMVDISVEIYSNFKPTVSDIMYATLLSAYTDTVDRSVMSFKYKIIRGEADESDISLYKTNYDFYVATLKLWSKKCSGLLKNGNKRLKSKLDVYGGALCDDINYDVYIKSCISRAQKDVDSGLVVIENKNVTKYTSDGTIIDDQYDSKESIKKKLEEIQKKYVPNKGQVWKENYKGSIQCNGFARMVFNLLYGYDISGYVAKKRYRLANENNVVKVGYLVNENVTKTNLKQIFSKAQIGDYIQLCGGTYGQHSAIVLDVNDSGVLVYDCNWSNTPCEIKTHTFTWDNLVSWYSNPYYAKEYEEYIPNGVTIYRANNYESIYGDCTDLFYDDSVNFVIENGVLIKYNGWQTYVVIPEEVTEIGYSAFENNTTMMYVEIPDSVKKIGAYAFSGCSELRCVDIPDSVEEIGDYAFNKCIKLSSAHLPDNEKYISISEGIFKHDEKLSNINFPDNVTSIGSFSFYNCDSLKQVILPRYLITLSGGAFFDCDKIKSLWIPKSIENVYTDTDFNINYRNNGAFDSCDNLIDIEFEEGITFIPSNMLYGCNGLTEIAIPDTITKIGDSAFYNCSSLENVDFSNSLISIGSFSFYNCDKISEVIFPNGLTTLNGGCFFGCDGLENVYIPKSIKNTYLDTDFFINYRNNGVFDQCSRLHEVKFQEGITELTSNMFFGCTGLENITIPDTVKTINKQAFMGCTNLKEIVVPDSVVTYDEGIFQSCEKLEKAKLPDHWEKIPKNTFSGCSSLVSFKVPEDVITIYPYAFYGCEGLENIIFNDNLALIGSSSFYECKSLKSIILPNNVKAINSSAFSHCESLEEVALNDGLITIDSSAFEYDKKLKNIKLPDTMNYLGAYVFRYCDSLNKVEFGSGISEVSSYAFYECPQINTIVLPVQFKSIAEYAFGNCTNLSDITINRNVNNISLNAFSYLDRLTIHGIPGTYAETFAKENDIKFVALENGAEAIKLSRTKINIGAGEKIKLTASITPVDAIDELTWSSTDDDIVKVDSEGNVTAVAPGEATILAMAGSIIESCEVTVYRAVNSVYLDKSSYEGSIGEEFTLIATIYPSDATYQTVTWESSNNNIAEVDSQGKVTLKAYGTANITVKTDDKEKTYTCTVTVKPINVTGVALNEKKIEIEAGKTVQLTATISPENATNKSVTWSSSKPDIATVKDGLVTGRSVGSSVIIVKTVDGSKTATCTVTVKTAVHTHEWNEGVVTKAPTCIEAGEKAFTCKTCEETKVESIEMVPHNLTENKAVDAKCEETGNSLYYHCSMCKKYFSDAEGKNEIEENSWIIPPTGHDWGEWTVTKEVTETEKGEYTRVCSNDPSHIETKEIPEKSHVHNMTFVEAVEAKCNKPGNKAYYKCEDCGNYYNDENGESLIWDESELIITISHSGGVATCVSKAICETCGEEYGQIDPNNHNIVDIDGTEATCSKAGLTKGRKCSLCGKITQEQKEIPALGHDWDDGEITTPTTCTKDGIKTFHCKREDCKETKTESIKASGHNVEILPSVPASCTHSGKTEGKKCKVCGELIEAQKEVPATGHKWDNGKVTKESNETMTGIKTYTCSICGETKTEEIPVKEKEKGKEETGVGTVSADGTILTDTDGIKYLVSTKLKANQIKKNISVADKKSGGKYKITKIIKKNGKVVGGNVTYMAPYNKNCTKATAGATVKICGVKFNITAINAKAFKDCIKLNSFKAGGNVTTIGKNAFNGCSNLKSVTITSTKLKSIGTGAFKGTTAKTKFKVPKSKLSKYSKMIYKAGANKKAKITK